MQLVHDIGQIHCDTTALGRHGDDRSLGLGAGLNLVGSDGHRLQFLAGLFQIVFTVDALTFRKVKHLRNGVVTHTRNQQGVASVGNAVDIEIAVLVGRATEGGTFEIDIGEHHGFTCWFLIDKAFDAIVLSNSRIRSKNYKKRRKKQPWK